MASGGMVIDEKDFMEEIRLYPVIWNKFSSDFKNKHIKVKAFGEIASKFIMDNAEAAENKYNNIRSVYTRSKKKKPSGSGRAGVTNPNHTHLSWLDPYISQRKTATNVVGQASPFTPPCSNKIVNITV